MLLVTAELPKLAFTFVRKFLPVCTTHNMSERQRHNHLDIASQLPQQHLWSCRIVVRQST
jgi:hypothetical protein